MPHVDGYIFPCPTCGNGAGQVGAAVSNLRNQGATIGMLWLDIEGTQYWMDQNSNRNFFNSLVQGCASSGVTCGVYSSASQWNPIMGSFTGGSSMPLWYAHCTSYIPSPCPLLELNLFHSEAAREVEWAYFSQISRRQSSQNAPRSKDFPQ